MKDTREGRQPPNFLHNEEQHMRIKNERKLTVYQVQMFKRERGRLKRRLRDLDNNQEHRAEIYGAQFKTRKELDEAYILGGMTDKEYMKQRSAIWNAYSDRGYNDRIKWCDQMIEHYQAKLDKIDAWIENQHRETEIKVRKRYMKKQKHYAYKRRKRREARSAAKKENYKLMKERWKYYGLR